MIKAELNAEKSMAAMEVKGSLKDLFLETCMFFEAMYDYILKNTDKETTDALFEGFIKCIEDRMNGESPEAVAQVVEVDANLIKAAKRFKEGD